MAIALGSMDAHAHGVVAKVGSEVEEDGGLLDLLAGAILDNGGDLGGGAGSEWMVGVRDGWRAEETRRTMESNTAAFSLQPIW